MVIDDVAGVVFYSAFGEQPSLLGRGPLAGLSPSVLCRAEPFADSPSAGLSALASKPRATQVIL